MKEELDVESCPSPDVSDSTVFSTDVLAGSGTSHERSATGNFFSNQAEKKKKNTPSLKKKIETPPEQKTTGKKNMNAFKVKKAPSRDMNLKEANQKTIPTKGSSNVSRSMSNKDWTSFFDQVISSCSTEDNEVS